jgi:hypothetical protein
MPANVPDTAFFRLPDGRYVAFVAIAFTVDPGCNHFNTHNVSSFVDLSMTEAEKLDGIEQCHRGFPGAPTYHYSDGSAEVYTSLDEMVAKRALIESGWAL